MNIKTITTGLLAGLISMSATLSHAAVVEWTLNNVAFNDGGTASGSFKIDYKDGGSLSFADFFDINIQATAGTNVTTALTFDDVRGYSSTPPFSGSPGYKINSIGFTPTIGNSRDFDNWIELSFDSGLALSNVNTLIAISTTLSNPFNGQIFAIYSGQSTEDDYADRVAQDLATYERYLVSGSVSGALVSPVPVPAAAWLFGSALLGLAGIKRKGLAS